MKLNQETLMSSSMQSAAGFSGTEIYQASRWETEALKEKL